MSNVKKETKDGTKNVPPPTSGEVRSRVTAETEVTKGREGIRRMKALMLRLLPRQPTH